jgi:hypothetical protein
VASLHPKDQQLLAGIARLMADDPERARRFHVPRARGLRVLGASPALDEFGEPTN